MSESPDVAQLDATVLKNLVSVLLADRSASVAESLPHVLNALVSCEPETGLQQGEDKHVRWEHARANVVTEIVECALNSDIGDKTWLAAEEEWCKFVHMLVSNRQKNSEALAGLKAVGGPATLALSPLLSFLLHVGEVSEKKVLSARGFYARALYFLLQSHLLGTTVKESVMWLRRYDWSAELSELLQPFLQYEVEPLAKELAFHFQEGKKTARREEPQHFFSFLLQLYERYVIDTRAHGWELQNLAERDSISLIALGSVTLASIASSVFRSVYGWYEGSKLFLVNDFIVHGANSFIDFLDKARGVVHESAQLLLAESILLPSVLYVFFETARVTAERSFTTGARALWRREFLLTDPPRAFSTICGTHHMLRCLEALIRRLTVVFTLLPSCALNLWKRTVVPCMSNFLCVLDKAKETCSLNLDTVVVFLELIDCAYIMHSAAEEWMEQCCEVCGGAEITSAPLDRLALWRDELTRETAHIVKGFLTRLFGATDMSERDLYAWESIMCILSRRKVAAYAIVYEDMRLALTQYTTVEQRCQLRDYCKINGMEAVVNMLCHISV